MKIKDIFEGLALVKEIEGDLDKEITSICCDSRKVENGSLFVAIRGFKSDGRVYFNDVIKKGAKAVVTENNVLGKKGVSPNGTAITCISVHDTRKALALLSAKFYGYPSKKISVIGITGTNGKTTTSYLLESVLKINHFKTGRVGTIDYRFNGEIIPASHTTPESIDLQYLLKRMADSNVKYCVMEVSSHSLELERVYGMRFETGIFTNLTQDHLDFHGTEEKYFTAKEKLFKEYGLKKAVINTDNGYGKRLLKDINAGEILTYGIEEKADVIARDIYNSIDGLRFFVDTPAGEFRIESRLIGKYNVYNILAAVSAGILEELPRENIIKGIFSVNSIPGRLETIDEGQDFTVLVDYAHTDDALKNVLKSAKELPHNKLIVVFGCGGDRDRGKRPLMGRVGVEHSDFAIITSDNPRSEEPLKIIEEIEAGVLDTHSMDDLLGAEIRSQRYIRIPDRREAIEFSINKASKGDIVIIAGKGHEDYQIFRDKRIHFDDREIAREEIRKVMSNER